MWLTNRELCQELRISPHTLKEWRKKRKIRFIRIGNTFRYQLPSPSERNVVPQVERVAFISYAEAAQIIGTSKNCIAVHVSHGTLKPIAVGRRRYFTIKELRRYIADREKRTGQARQHASEIIVNWVRKYLETGKVPVQVLEQLIKEAAKLPEPGKSQAVSKLWNLFDEVNEILFAIERAIRRDGCGG